MSKSTLGQGGLTSVHQIFTLELIGEKAQEKKCRLHVGFIGLEKAYNRLNWEAL